MGARTARRAGPARGRACLAAGAAQGAADARLRDDRRDRRALGRAWRPSPGSVYPTLQLLEEEGLVTAEEVGGKRLVQLTEAGRTEAEAGPDEPWAEAGQEVDWAAVQEVGQALGAVEQAVRQVMATGSEAQRAKGLEVLNEARKKLYLILAEDA